MQPIPQSRPPEGDELARDTALRQAKLQLLMLEARRALAESRQLLAQRQTASRKMTLAILEARERLEHAHRKLR